MGKEPRKDLTIKTELNKKNQGRAVFDPALARKLRSDLKTRSESGLKQCARAFIKIGIVGREQRGDPQVIDVGIDVV